MKSLLFVLGSFALLETGSAKEPVKPRSSVPGKYPAIIQMTPPDPAAPPAAGGILQSELGGREVEFLQHAREFARQLSALAEVARGRESSEQVKSVGEMLASMQATETEKLEALARAKQLPATGADAAELKSQLTSLQGLQYEKAWVDRLIAVTDGSVRAYEVGAKSADADVHAFVEKMLPVAKARSQMAARLGGRPVATPTPAPAKPAAAKAATEPAPIEPPVTAAPAAK